MNFIFQIVYKILMLIASIFGLTYHEVNIIVYFIVIPGIFMYLLGRITNKKWLFAGFILIISFSLYIIPDFRYFSTYLFKQSVDFLNSFVFLGLNYIQASVVVCVILPILMLWALVRWNKHPQNKSKSS
ncbi:MAG: hypothetical protein COA58_12380 [Bacteroidetes bacterium]|nr:MAG: hypothetical protein COA58_12380 [Bacteroidota bacterium]